MIKYSFIGMSGVGKSHWAQKLAHAGFRAISIDDAIEENLAPELAAGGYRGIGGVAAWMGWPDRSTYREREKLYLNYEIECMQEVLDEIESTSNSQGIVLDTTGSVIYTGDEVRRRLRDLTVVVYLQASAAEEELLIARYLSDPKPVLWGDQFSQEPGESIHAAIARCYRKLLAHRKAIYEQYAHRVVPMERLRGAGVNARNILELIESQARPAL